ncbi:MAG: sugar phosphate isomerase/epimerase family protein [Planctomycetota bacterium]
MALTVGAQLYTVREYTKTIEGVAETFRKIKDIGYQAVQISGFGPVDYKQVGKLAKETGLDVAATHVGWKRFREELDAVIEEHQCWECKHAAIGGLPADYHTEEGLKKFIDELAPISEKLAAAGLDFSYHNHNNEFKRYGDTGKTWLEMLYESAPADMLKAELDVYWVTAGGGSPATWIKKLGKRQPLVHFKDMTITPEREQHFAPVGKGNLDWPAIIDACRQVDAQYALVEQDNAYGADPFAELAASYRFLTESGLS